MRMPPFSSSRQIPFALGYAVAPPNTRPNISSAASTQIVRSVSHNGFRILADKSVPKDLDAAGVVTRCYQDDAIASAPGEFSSDRAHFVRSDVIRAGKHSNRCTGYSEALKDHSAVDVLRRPVDSWLCESRIF